MITPLFSISQTEEFVVIQIRTPHARIQDAEVDYGENMFWFSCAPYFLRLHFKQMINECGERQPSIQFDHEKDEFKITVEKRNRGEHFEDLEMITELLRPTKIEYHGRGMVEELDEEEEQDEEEEEDPDEFLHPQKVTDVEEEIKLMQPKANEFGYGFACKKIGILEKLRDEIGNLVDLRWPEQVAIVDRLRECEMFDTQNFDEERYLTDTFLPEEELKSIIAMEFKMELELTDEDKIRLKDLKTKTSLKGIRKAEHSIALGLIDLIFCYCYEQRVNSWEMSCESGWSLSKLSPMLSYLVRYESARGVMVACMRRCLVYPLYRSWDLTMRVVDDVKTVLAKDKSAIVHILCEYQRTLNTSGEFRYILNDLYVTDYLVWFQGTSSELMEEISKEVEAVKVGKADIGLDLEMLDLEAKLVNATFVDSDDDVDEE